jgi:signal transduction histidine kinase/ligand-binding sensor domain-containing protein
MPLLRIGSFLAIACGLTCPASGLDPNKTISQFTHTSWSAKDGIPGPVRAIEQTPDGYLWLGTPAGLYRFDGLHFVSWEAAAPGGEKLPGSSILSLFTARDGSLWIGFASGGLGRLRNGTLRMHAPGDGLVRGVGSIVEDNNGVIWAGGSYGFSRFENGKWNRVGAELGYPAPGAQRLVVDHRGTLWVATNGMDFGLSKDSVSVNTILKLAPNGRQFEATGQPVAQVLQLAEAPDGEVWIVTIGNASPGLRPLGQDIVRELRGPPYNVIFDGPSSLWIGLYQGGIRRAPDFKRLERLNFDRFEKEDGLSNEGVRSSFMDREGTIWFGTTRGLDRFRENKATPYVAKNGLLEYHQEALTSTRDGVVWISNFSLDVVQHLVGGRIVNQTLPPYSRSDSTRVVSIYSDKSDHVWLGGSFNLAAGIDGKFSFTKVPGTPEKSTVEAITTDSSGNLWITVWDGNTSRVKRLRNGTWTDFRDSPELPNYRCRVLFGDTLGRVWLGFESGGVAVYENDRFRRYSASDGLPPSRVLSITNDRTGHVWVGGEGGLSRFDGRQFVTLTKENGLPGPLVSAVLEDDDGFLWIAGPLGIIRVSSQEVENAVKSPSYRMQRLFVDTIDGLPGLPRQGPGFPTATKAADGRLWFSTTDGIAVIDPRRLPMNPLPPPVVIQSVTADDQTFAISPQLHFRPKLRNVEIGFAALSLAVPERVLFRYKLEGYDNDWHGPTGTRLATYTNLPPRRYRFRVVGSNNDGVWNEAGATLEFDIAPMFYQMNWFLLLCGMLASFLMWVVYRWRLRLVTARLDLQYAERLSERERIARELHDTLLQALQGLMLRFQAAAKGIPDDDPTRQTLEGALDRADEVMAEGRDRVRGLRTSRDGGDDLSQALSNVAQEFVDASQTAFRVMVEGAVRRLHPLVRDEAYRIGSEALINAFLHANSRKIELEISYSRKELRIRIQDDGRGIDPEVLASGGRASHWGLRGMKERASKIRSQLEIRSKVDWGTEIELVVPGRIAYEGALGKSDRQTLTSSN